MSDTAEIAILLDRLMRRIESRLNATAATFDLERVGQLGGMALLTLAEIEPAATQDLVTRMARDKSQITRLVQMLETKGMITRSACPDDGRVSLLSTTRKGKAFVKDIQTHVAAVLDDILAPASKTDRARLADVLRRL